MDVPEETGWPRLLQFLGHELRNSLTVIAGYPRMLRGGRGGPLTDMQQFMVGEIEKGAERIRVLLGEISDIAAIESGRAVFRSTPVDLRRVLSDAVAALPPDPSYHAEVVLGTGNGAIQVTVDERRLTAGFTSLFWALRRQLLDSRQLLVRTREGQFRGKPAEWITIGAPDRIAEFEAAAPDTFTEFDECRGGSGLGLALARRVIDHSGGGLWSPDQDTKAAAVVVLPRS